MERVRKMVIVPEDAIMRSEATKITVPSSSSDHVSESSNTTQTPGDNLSRLDAKMFDILHSKKVKGVHEKCHNYLEVLRRYLFFPRTRAK